MDTPFEIYSLENASGDSSFNIIPGYGCALVGLKLNGFDIITTPENIEASLKGFFFGSQLFPFPNRLKAGKYIHADKAYAFEINELDLENALHGILYNRPFNVKHESDDEKCMVTEYQFDGRDLGFPFKTKIENKFSLTKTHFTAKTSILNQESCSIPFGHGWHPYFNSLGLIDDCYLIINSTAFYPTDEYLIPTMESNDKLPFMELKKIRKSQLNDCFKINNEQNEMARLVNRKDGYEILIVSDSYKYLQVYTSDDRKSIALEPQTCAPDALNNGYGKVQLNPNESIDLTLKIAVRKLT